MNIKSVIRRIANITSESIYLKKYHKSIRKNTVYCCCAGINIPEDLKCIRSAVNAQYIITDKPFPDYFIKKPGQTTLVICSFMRNEFFGKLQRTILMADYLVCAASTNVKQFFNDFDIDGLFKGQIVIGYDCNVFENIVKGKYANCQYKKNCKNVIIYSGSLAQNGLTASLLNLLSNLENDSDVNYMITYRENSLKSSPERLNKLPNVFHKIPMAGDFRPSMSEFICYVLYFKLNIAFGFVVKRLERLFKREWRRFFGAIDIDTAVQFTGYEYGVIKLFEQFSGNKIIFVHNDMVSEIKYRKNQHYMTLREAYQKYDTVALVTEDMRKSTVKISGLQGNLQVIPNCHDYKSVLKRSLLPVEFQEETECNISFNDLKNILDSDIEKFITIGRFSAEKAHIRLIDAFCEYCRIYPQKKTCLIIIGGRGELYEHTVGYAKKTGQNIILIRSMENPMPLLKKCDLFMLPSEYEGLGLVLLEADTLGIPVFATDIPGPRGFLREYGGFLVKNSLEGILSGMELYSKGKITPMNIDYEKYNQTAVNCFKKII